MSSETTTQTRNKHALSSAREICRAIKESDAAIRQQYPFLYHQDRIGALIFVGSLFFMLLCSYLYLSSYLSAVWTIILIALSISLLHELEHDIIHNLYFKKHKWVQNVMFLFIWFAKLHISPWYRRQLHLKHHLLSGQLSDAEERLIGLGLPPSYKRMAVSMHPFGGLLVSDDISKDAKFFNTLTLQLHNAPMGLVFFITNLSFLTYNLLFFAYFILNYDVNTIPGIYTFFPFIRILAVCLCFPNLLRQGCLVLMSNSSHYYGDIPMNTVFYQNQILDSWLTFPFQLFCFNFGATHIVHHYVPSQPFYIRHFTARSIKAFMISMGVRNNDFGILWRSNRYTVDPNEDAKHRLYGKCWFAACAMIGFPLYILWDLLIFFKFSNNVLNLILELIKSRSIEATDSNVNYKLMANDIMMNGDPKTKTDGISQLNTLVNRITLNSVSADQIEDLSIKAVATY